ncbi:hypothetical protein EVAR_39138_1 [Eumeta japonica]|uniref:Uncharacterized protein n=1 Tax=Eumeta variegata TaxID=151549 RepID=A0A4C1X9M6_EUMVA|nr:hypothetical protein EVAR_39138_1 [Eumeta japonica]
MRWIVYLVPSVEVYSSSPLARHQSSLFSIGYPVPTQEADTRVGLNLKGPGGIMNLRALQNPSPRIDRVVSLRVSGVVGARAGRGPAGKRHLDCMTSPTLADTALMNSLRLRVHMVGGDHLLSGGSDSRLRNHLMK